MRLKTNDAARRLCDGGVLLLATDTIPGLHCRADNPSAVGRIVAAKASAPGKPLLVLAASLPQVQTITGPLTASQLEICGRCWPGPFTLIMPASGRGLPEVTGGGGTIAVRVPAVPALCELLVSAGGALVSTSANRAGEPATRNLAGAWAIFRDEVDGCWGTDPEADGEPVPSAIVDLTVSPPKVVRRGPLAFPRTSEL